MSRLPTQTINARVVVDLWAYADRVTQQIAPEDQDWLRGRLVGLTGDDTAVVELDIADFISIDLAKQLSSLLSRVGRVEVVGTGNAVGVLTSVLRAIRLGAL